MPRCWLARVGTLAACAHSMSTMTQTSRHERAAAVREIIRRLHTMPEEKAWFVLDNIGMSAPPNTHLRHLATDKTRRSHLTRIAFPHSGADRVAVTAGVQAGNTIESLWHLAAGTSFVHEGHRFPAQALKNPDGSWCMTKTGTVRVVYSAERLTASERKALRS